MLSVPEFYGSAGEPFMGHIPSIGPAMPMSMPTLGSPIGLILGLGAMGMMRPQPVADDPIQLDMQRITDALRNRLRAMENETLEAESPSFGQAFSRARKAGLNEFSWRGRQFHTRLREET
ncbi:MAG: hypothetical protein L0312_19615 [Acidobacteria bacterium]|nr:hypothetical protein [Acidobacteriota bacterium]